MSKYEDLRKELLDDIEAQKENDVISLKDFDRKFNKLFELVNFDLLTNDPFYGSFVSHCNRVKCYVIRSPFSHQTFNSKVNLLINPLEVIKLTADEVKQYMKHETIHLVSEHYKMVESLKEKYPEMLPLLAADLVTNTILQDEIGANKLHNKLLTVDSFNKLFKADLNIYDEKTRKNMGIIELTEHLSQMCKTNEDLNKFVNDYNSFVIDKAQEDMEEQIRKYKNGMDDSEMTMDDLEALGGEMDGEMSPEMQQAMMQQLANMLMSSIMKVKGDLAFISDMLKNVVITTMGESRGKYPGGLMSAIEKLTAPPVITWQQVLAKLLNSVPAGKKPTVFRRNRLHPERLDLKGKLPDKDLDIVFAIDTSGSVTNREISEIANELFSITKLMKTSVKVLECDTHITRIYDASCPEDIKLDVTGRGGTSFTPVFEWIEENKNKDTILIYASDGYGESHIGCKNITQSTIWLMTREKACLSCKTSVRPQDKVLSLTNK